MNRTNDPYPPYQRISFWKKSIRQVSLICTRHGNSLACHHERKQDANQRADFIHAC